MRLSHDDALDLLERSLGYTRGRLSVVAPHHVHRATPCAGWDLRDLLAHMDDALDAFTEAASGYVAVPAPAATPVALGSSATTRVDTLQHKACALLGAWLSSRSAAGRGPDVVVADSRLDPVLLMATAALEITVHGWDVAVATGERAAVPDALASDLAGLARLLVDRDERAPQFGPARPVDADATASQRLLAWTGRGTEPPTPIPGVPPAQGGLAS